MRAELGMNEHGLLVCSRRGWSPAGNRAGDRPGRATEGSEGCSSSPRRLATKRLDYLLELERRQAEAAKVRLRYAADRFEPDLEGKPVGPAHTLHDAPLAADLITYPSLYEGYGNALIEAIFFRSRWS